MSEKNAMTFSQEECRKEYKNYIQEGKERFDAAVILAGAGKFGPATSMLIISNEIHLEALILFLDGLGFRFRSVKGMSSLFKNHRLRYLLGFGLDIMSLFTEELKKIFPLVQKNPNLVKKLNWKNPEMAPFMKDYMLEQLDKVDERAIFFSNIDSTRQRGLYVDYEGNILKIGEEEYRIFHDKIETLNKVVEELIESFDSKEEKIIEVINHLKDEFAETSYTALGMMLEKINKPQFDSYQVLREMIDEFRKDFSSDYYLKLTKESTKSAL